MVEEPRHFPNLAFQESDSNEQLSSQESLAKRTVGVVDSSNGMGHVGVRTALARFRRPQVVLAGLGSMPARTAIIWRRPYVSRKQYRTQGKVATRRAVHVSEPSFNGLSMEFLTYDASKPRSS